MGECEQGEFLCTWKIKNYSVPIEKGLWLHSPYFRSGSGEWNILLDPNRIPGYITCKLNRGHYMNSTVTVGIQYTLKNSNGQILTATEMTTETVIVGYHSTLRKVIGIDDLKKKMSSCKEDKLVLCCFIRQISAKAPPHLSDVSYNGCEIETTVYDYEISFEFRVKFSDKNHFTASKEVNSKFLERITFEYSYEGLQIELFANIADESRQNFDCTIELLNELGNQVISEKKAIKFGPESHKYSFPVFIYKRHFEEANCYNFGVLKLNVIISPRFTSNINYCKEDSTNSKIPAIENSTFASPNIAHCSIKVLKVDSSSKACQTNSTIIDDVKSQSGPSTNVGVVRSNGDDACTFSLQRDLRNLFNGKLHTDVELRVGSNIFPAHKSFLATRSPVFRAMFDQDNAENNTGVNIHDVERNIMTIFLEYFIWNIFRIWHIFLVYLRKFFMRKLDTDVELQVGSERFPVHKNLLVARSPVFLTMFVQYMTGNYTRVVDIHDVEENIMKLFLEYIYTGSVDGMDSKVALSLMLVANKYQVLSLVEKCSLFLKSVLCINNALDVLSVAERVNQEQLKSSAIEYIIDNSTEILSLTEWSQWIKLNTTLSSEVFLELSKKLDAVLKSVKAEKNNSGFQTAYEASVETSKPNSVLEEKSEGTSAFPSKVDGMNTTKFEAHFGTDSRSLDKSLNQYGLKYQLDSSANDSNSSLDQTFMKSKPKIVLERSQVTSVTTSEFISGAINNNSDVGTKPETTAHNLDFNFSRVWLEKSINSSDIKTNFQFGPSIKSTVTFQPREKPEKGNKLSEYGSELRFAPSQLSSKNLFSLGSSRPERAVPRKVRKTLRRLK